MIVPGNGGSTPTDNFYKYVELKLKDLGFEVLNPQYPDAEIARAKYWLPFIEEQLCDTNNSILIGHSTGVVAIMRYLEKHKAKNAILVGAYYTDLGMESEKESGYFDEPWNWDLIKSNVENIYIINSKDDPYIDIKYPRYMAKKLDATFLEFETRGHFNDYELPEIIDVVKNNIGL